MKPQQLFLTVLALGCGLAAMFLTRSYMAREQQPQGPDPNLVPVVVAKQNIKAATKITLEMVEIGPRHKDLLPGEVMTKIEEVVGKSAHVDIFAPEPILRARLSDMDGIPAMLRTNMVAVTIPVTVDRAVGGFIQTGSVVDVLLTVPARGDAPSFSRYLVPNMRVLAWGNKVERESQSGPTVGNLQANSVTLEATRNQALMLNVSRNLGELSLTLGAAGQAPADPSGVVTSDDILNGRPNEEPEVLPPFVPTDPLIAFQDLPMFILDYKGFKIRLAKNHPLLDGIGDKAREAASQRIPVGPQGERHEEKPANGSPPAEG